MSFKYPILIHGDGFCKLIMITTEYLLKSILNESNGLINICKNKFCNDNNHYNANCFFEMQNAGSEFTPNKYKDILKYHKFKINILDLLSLLKAYEHYSIYENVINDLNERLLNFLKEFSKQHGKIRYIINVSSDSTKYIIIQVYYNSSLCNESCQKYHKQKVIFSNTFAYNVTKTPDITYTEDDNIILNNIMNELLTKNLSCSICNKKIEKLSNIKEKILCDYCRNLHNLINDIMYKYNLNKKIIEDIKIENPPLYEYCNNYKQNEPLKTFANFNELLTYFKEYFSKQLLNDNDYNQFKNSYIFNKYDETILTFEQFMQKAYYINLYNNYEHKNNNIFYIYINNNLIHLYINNNNKDILSNTIKCIICNLPIIDISNINNTRFTIKVCNKCMNKQKIFNTVYYIVRTRVENLIYKNYNNKYTSENIINIIKQEIRKLSLKDIEQSLSNI